MNLTDYDRFLTLPEPPRDPVAAADLARGPLGTGLYLAAHPDPPHPALQWIKAAAHPTVYAGTGTGLLAGAPALAFTIACATGGTVPRPLHRTVLDGIRARLAAAEHRIAAAAPANFAEYDLFAGLTGLGAYLLHTDPTAPELTAILDHLALLADPAHTTADGLPLWWTGHAPTLIGDTRLDRELDTGHGNFGTAHGIAGPLALLALATISQAASPAHIEAIEHYLAIFDHWQQPGDAPWWPQWITRNEHDSQTSRQRAPGRPSWCYGTPGIARAQQVAGIALGDRQRAQTAAQALRASLTDPDQLDRVTDSSLCHGWAGIYQTAWRARQDAPELIDQDLLDRIAERITLDSSSGLLEGAPGQALAMLTRRAQGDPCWDRLLLLA